MSASEELLKIQVVWDAMHSFYGEIMMHSLPEGGVCVHLGHDAEDKGCVQPSLFEAFSHALDHYQGDAQIEMAAEEVRKNPEEAPQDKGRSMSKPKFKSQVSIEDTVLVTITGHRRAKTEGPLPKYEVADDDLLGKFLKWLVNNPEVYSVGSSSSGLGSYSGAFPKEFAPQIQQWFTDQGVKWDD